MYLSKYIPNILSNSGYFGTTISQNQKHINRSLLEIYSLIEKKTEPNFLECRTCHSNRSKLNTVLDILRADLNAFINNPSEDWFGVIQSKTQKYENIRQELNTLKSIILTIHKPKYSIAQNEIKTIKQKMSSIQNTIPKKSTHTPTYQLNSPSSLRPSHVTPFVDSINPAPLPLTENDPPTIPEFHQKKAARTILRAYKTYKARDQLLDLDLRAQALIDGIEILTASPTTK